MSATNLSIGRTKLHHSLKKLSERWMQAREHWNDEQAVRFQEEHIEPLEPMVQRTMQGVERLTQILLQAEKECG